MTAVGVLIPFAPVLLGARTLAQRDTDRLYAPVRTLVVDALRDGRLPLWNPHEGLGKPLFAEGIHSVLHPISLLGAAVAPASIDFLLLAYLVSAAIGAFLLARALGASPPASAGAGLAFALSGYSVSMTGNLVFLAGLSTLPWLVAAARLAGLAHRWGPVLTALATACAFLSGDVQVTLVGVALGLLLATAAGGMRGALRALVGVLVGALLAGVQLATTEALLPFTQRAARLAPWERTQWALSPTRLLEWILPGLLRGDLAVPQKGAGVFAESIYLGAPVLVAAALGARAGGEDRRRSAGPLLALAAGVLLWLAFGHHLGATTLLDWAPIWSRFRYAEKLMAPLTLCASTLAALGIDRLGARSLSRPCKAALAALALTGGVAFLGLTAATTAPGDDPSGALLDAIRRGLPHLVAGVAALLAVDRLPAGRLRVAALATAVALAPAAAVRAGAHFGLPDARRPGAHAPLDSDAPAPRVAHPDERVAEASADADMDFVDASARQSLGALFPSTNVAARVDTIACYGGFKQRRLWNLAEQFPSWDTRWARVSRRFGLTHVVAPTTTRAPRSEATALAVEGGWIVQSDPRLGVEIWAVPHRPWAFFATRALAAGSPRRSRELLGELIAAGDDGTVVVESPERPLTAPGRVLAVERTTASLRIEAEAEGDALLVIQDAYWPGWRAALDGRPATIDVADHLVRAVRWPPGRHRLVMTYEPPGLVVGLLLSGIGLIITSALAAAALRWPRAFRAGPALNSGRESCHDSRS